MKPNPAPFIRLEHNLMNTVAWQSLSGGAVRTLLYIWSRHNGRNNGAITCSVKDLAQHFGCSRHSVVKWLSDLEDKGFIVATRRGSFQIKSGSFVGRATTWRLTMESFERRPPTREYLSWTPPARQEFGS